MLNTFRVSNLTKNNIFRYGELVLLASTFNHERMMGIGFLRNLSSNEKIPKIVSNSTGSIVSPNIIQNGQSMIKNKLNSIYDSYEKFSHMDEIREAHQNVENLQEELKVVQQRRRDIAKELNNIRYDLQLCYADLANCTKGDPRYLEVIRKEYELHHKEKMKTEEFNLQDKAERDLFTHLQAAVKTSHEKEKIHTNSAKYWSIVGSLLGTLLGILGTTFSFYNRNNMITTMISEIKAEFIQLKTETIEMNNELKKLVEEQKKLRENLNVINYKEKLMNRSSIIVGSQSNESWLHWFGRQTYVISIYRYFSPAKL